MNKSNVTTNIKKHGVFILKMVLGVLLFIAPKLHSQMLKTGAWKTHLSYQRLTVCEASSRFIYAASEQGFFRVKESTNEIELLGKTDGFNGQEITAMNFQPNLDVLVIGYRDGQIDLLFNDSRIVNVPGLYNKSLQGDKTIYHINFTNDKALISSYFGLLIVDLNNHQISDSYNTIGDFGTSIPVFSSCVMGDSIYIGTNTGIRSAKWSKLVNLNDFNEWHWIFKTAGIPCNHLAHLNDSLFFATDSTAYRLFQGDLRIASPKRKIARIWNNNQGLHLVYPGAIVNWGGTGSQNINLVNCATQFSNGIYWFGTGIDGGLIKKASSGEISYMPSGPSGSSVFKMTQQGNFMLATAGGVTATFGNSFNVGGFYIYNNGQWKNNLKHPFNQNLYDFTYVTYCKKRDWQIACSHSFGMLVFKNNEIIARWDQTNSPLTKRVDSFIWTSGVAEDKNGNIWITSFGAEKALICYTTSNTWKSFALKNNQVKGITIDQNNNKWMILQDGGILVFNEGKLIDDESDDLYYTITTKNGLKSNDINVICADNLGYVWIGTTQGLNIYTGVGKLFINPKVDPFVIEQNGSIGYLMGEENITDILYDGANRKWMSSNNGLFLIEPYGQRVIRQFQTTNSPLISNRIFCIGQVDETGEIFVGTDKGIQSYRSDSKSDNGSFDEQLKIYPNPVPPTFTGLVTIEGLTNNAIVKITDAQGVLVSETKANGGKATWDGKRLDGSTPSSGVLFVMAINEDGTEKAMGKFIFIRPPQ